MYVINESIAITWEIHSQLNKVLTQDLFDVIVIEPDGTSTYYVDPTTAWVAPLYVPGSKTLGSMSYAFTANTPGKWTILLVTGTNAAYTILDAVRVHALCGVNNADISITSACAIPIMAPIESCDGEIPFVLAQAPYQWTDIFGICPHLTNSYLIVIIGRIATDAAGSVLKVGILDVRTGVTTILPDALEPDGTGISLGNATGSRTTAAYGLVSLPSEGLYVYARAVPYSSPITMSSNEYPTFYSTDLITWNESLHIGGTQFSGPGMLKHDPDTNRTWWGGNDIFSSLDGITFYRQYFKNYLENDQVVGQVSQMLLKGDYAADPDKVIMAGNSSLVFVTEDASQELPILPGGVLPHSGLVSGGYWGPMLLNAPYDALATDGTRVVAFQNNGYCQYNDHPIANSTWQVGAQSTGHGGPTNTFLDNAYSMTAFTFRDGNFWAMRISGSAGVWYRSTTCEANEWTQDDTGPFGTTTFHKSINKMILETKTSKTPYVYAGTDGVVNIIQYVFYGEPN